MKTRDLGVISVILIFGIAFVIAAPFLFTRAWSTIGFQGKGEIGDTIGGITAPITSLIGSFLVFFALRAQIDANRLIQLQFEQQKKEEVERKTLTYLSEQLKAIREDVGTLTFSYVEKEGEGFKQERAQVRSFSGAEAFKEIFLHSIANGLTTTHCEYEFMPRMELILIETVLTAIKALDEKISTSTTGSDRIYLRTLLRHTYNSKVESAYAGVYKDTSGMYEELPQGPLAPCSVCGYGHLGLPPSLHKLCEDLSQRFSKPADTTEN